MAAKMTYFEMAKEAIASLKERTGSSAQAIKAYIADNHKEINFQQHLLRGALNKGAESGKLVKVKASFKLAVAEKKIVVAKKAPAAAKVAVAKKAAPKKAAVKKTPVKKAVKAKSSSSVKKSPAPKKASKAKAAPKKKVGAKAKKASPKAPKVKAAVITKSGRKTTPKKL
eukprot:CAMPEP_0119041396 /NCGR_PEP_ID=MMETSP1177-20130426/11854_1 /TAXON_ID=2985 /ORGANISM="Ochromonas sp, Strain CCMP1899" /LENGTH=169 /DNA_ID=CAMNT_0007007411 /DNA_START=34 /DNA_END=543 /DNA_ORIENTATION=-